MYFSKLFISLFLIVSCSSTQVNSNRTVAQEDPQVSKEVRVDVAMEVIEIARQDEELSKELNDSYYRGLIYEPHSVSRYKTGIVLGSGLVMLGMITTIAEEGLRSQKSKLDKFAAQRYGTSSFVKNGLPHFRLTAPKGYTVAADSMGAFYKAKGAAEVKSKELTKKINQLKGIRAKGRAAFILGAGTLVVLSITGDKWKDEEKEKETVPYTMNELENLTIDGMEQFLFDTPEVVDLIIDFGFRKGLI